MNSNTPEQTGWALLTISEGEVVASVEYGEDEGTAREDYAAAVADQDGHGYRLTCNGYTYSQHLEPLTVVTDATVDSFETVTVTLAPDTPTQSVWTITDTEHLGCGGCIGHARTAAVYAVVSGSLVGSYTEERRNTDGILVVGHGAHVARTAPDTQERDRRLGQIVETAAGSDEIRDAAAALISPRPAMHVPRAWPRTTDTHGPAADHFDYLEA